MRITFSGKSSKLDKKIARAALHYYADYLIKKHDDIDLFVDFEAGYKKNTGDLAECVDEGLDNMYTITIEPTLSKKATLMALAHEMVHIKQYYNNELDYIHRKKVHRYKKNDYPEHMKYWDRPWEIEAFGREYGLYYQFVQHWNKKQRAKKTKLLKKKKKQDS